MYTTYEGGTSVLVPFCDDWQDFPCVYWTGRRDRQEYGTTWWNGNTCRVHRKVWIEEKGPIPPGIQVMHACDHPACYAIEHLGLGTNQDNADDRRRKGRYEKGEVEFTMLEIFRMMNEHLTEEEIVIKLQVKRARALVKNALRHNELIRLGSCEICGKTEKENGDPLTGHHWHGYDYEHALDVQWLCKACHARVHCVPAYIANSTPEHRSSLASERNINRGFKSLSDAGHKGGLSEQSRYTAEEKSERGRHRGSFSKAWDPDRVHDLNCGCARCISSLTITDVIDIKSLFALPDGERPYGYEIAAMYNISTAAAFAIKNKKSWVNVTIGCEF